MKLLPFHTQVAQDIVSVSALYRIDNDYVGGCRYRVFLSPICNND